MPPTRASSCKAFPRSSGVAMFSHGDEPDLRAAIPALAPRRRAPWPDAELGVAYREGWPELEQALVPAS